MQSEYAFNGRFTKQHILIMWCPQITNGFFRIELLNSVFIDIYIWPKMKNVLEFGVDFSCYIITFPYL